MATSGLIKGTVGAGAGNTPAVIPQVSWSTGKVSGNNSPLAVVASWVDNSPYATTGTFSGTLTVDGVGHSLVSAVNTGAGSGSLGSVAVTIPHKADGSRSVAISLSGSVSGTSAWTSTSLSGTAVLDKILSPPAAPTVPTVVRNGSRGVTLSWAFGSGGSGRSAVEVWRAKNGTWSKAATLGKDVTSYVDSGIDDLSRFVWRIRVLSASSYVDGPQTPNNFYWAAPVPAGLAAVKQADGSITVTTSSTGLLGLEWYRNGVLAATVGVGTAAVASSWTDDSPSSGANVYTAKAFAGATGVYRGYSALSAPSNTVSTLAKPNPPTNLKPNGGLAAVGSVALSWSHNPTDTTAQTTYELRWRASGGSTWTTLTGTTKQSHSLSVSTPGTYEFQVRTKGSFAEYSDWSAVASFTTITIPLVSVSSPSGQWISPILKLVWSWTQAQGRPQSSWRATLKDSGGAPLETKSGSGATSDYTFATRLEDGETYSVMVEAWAGDVAASPDTASFSVVFVPPAQPLLFGDWDDTTGSHTVTIANGDMVVGSVVLVGGVPTVRVPVEGAVAPLFVPMSFDTGAVDSLTESHELKEM